MRRMLMLVCSLLILAILEFGCGGGRSTPSPSASHSTFSPTLLRVLYRIVNGSDRVTTIGPDERSSYPLEGQLYNVADQPALRCDVPIAKVCVAEGNAQR
jgi:hypothetical protein